MPEHFFLEEMEQEAVLTLTSILSRSLVADFTNEDRIITFIAFAIYYVVQVYVLNPKLEQARRYRLLLSAWQVFGNFIVGLIVRDAIRAIRVRISDEGTLTEKLIVGFVFVMIALLLEDFDPLPNRDGKTSIFISQTVFALGLYYSDLLLDRVLEDRADFLLLLAYIWIHAERYIDDYTEGGRKRRVFVHRLIDLVTRISKFLLARWIVNFYEQNVTDDTLVAVLLWIPHVGGAALVAAALEGFDPEDAAVVRRCLESFALFLSSTTFQQFTRNRLPDSLLIIILVAIWYVLRRIEYWVVSLQAANEHKAFWFNWLGYTLHLAGRVASYTAVQVAIPMMVEGVGVMGALERMVVYAVIILFSTVFIWHH